jgi:hypothetical protein
MVVVIGILGLVLLVLVLRDLGGITCFRVWFGKDEDQEDQSDQEARDKGELPHGYFKKEK